MERPEAQDTGSIILTGFEPDIVLNSIATTIDEFQQLTQNTEQGIPQDYTITNTSWRVVKLILGNTKLSNNWWGVKK